MSNAVDSDETPVVSVQQLADYIAVGCKHPDEFRIGTEHEKFLFDRTTRKPLAYHGGTGINAVLQRLLDQHGSPILDDGHLIGVRYENGAAISLEPAGQLELSGAPLASLHDTQAELHAHLDTVRAIGQELGFDAAPLGFHPTMRRDDMPWMPKRRYAIMRRYMPLVGTRGLDMMLRTCTVQVNLDYASEQDMAAKLRVSLALQPLATALFANSPFREGHPSGLMSTRADVWNDTDPDRCGIPALFMSRSFGFEPYVQWLLDDVPMYFVRRDGRYIDVAGHTFRDFIAGRIPGLDDTTPTLADFADHMTTAFTEVRLKRFLEMRGADAGSPAMMVAQSALWVGLLYDAGALADAVTLTGGIGRAELLALRRDVPRLGLDARLQGRTLRELAGDVVAIAMKGLRARARRDVHGADETQYLAPLREIAAGAPNQSEYWLGRYRDAWDGDVTRMVGELLEDDRTAAYCEV
ncbi:glutamate--cysteine ligase [Paraburkholderia sp. D15]|uniref:glutamate--cysteine ligase n=1 Tax=Paraburkholderia sp. D15 TaxID=2880218 RepID=UPI00247AA3AF|nr:glutamate--cysteine ligase [Paraburkholderia sp. D15]WGS51603.1 glutamate--cysteine ligase [Paraburkholderia sp. D15]